MRWIKRKIAGLIHRAFFQTPVMKSIYKGLVIMYEILSASCEALDEKDPEFKYLVPLKVSNKFIEKILKYFKKYLFTSMPEHEVEEMGRRAIDHENAVRSLSSGDEFASTLASLAKSIPE